MLKNISKTHTSGCVIRISLIKSFPWKRLKIGKGEFIIKIIEKVDILLGVPRQQFKKCFLKTRNNTFYPVY